MIKEILKLQEQFQKDLDNSKSFDELKLLKSKYINKNEVLIEINKGFRNFSPEEKKQYGKIVSDYKNLFNTKFNEARSRIDYELVNNSLKQNIVDSSITVDTNSKGFSHPLNVLKKEIFNFFSKHGYVMVDSPIVETEEYNFDKLNIGKNHPARVMQDTFYLSDGKVLRTHATNSTSRVLEKMTGDNTKAFTIGKVFRNDDDDPTHYHQFNQIDIIDIGEDANLGKMKYVLEEFMKHIFGNDVELNFRPSYFPFTEPSLEVDIRSKELGGNGWIEVLGCGLINENVIKMSGKNPNKVFGFAIGVGLERLAMLKWGIKDIRHFYDTNLEFLNIMDGIN
ncbi:MAG: phenylalanine--tRNA ligase subunit alpha [Mycoplasmataceae bacterium]|nr:phenylalanine--tRNA ligase subunit alpha [Mycoplasmataceae bacterium]